jgi:hypothetical protein
VKLACRVLKLTGTVWMTAYPKRSWPVDPFCILGETKKTHKLSGPHFLRQQAGNGCFAGSGTSYFCFTAMAEISIRALLTRAAA